MNLKQSEHVTARRSDWRRSSAGRRTLASLVFVAAGALVLASCGSDDDSDDSDDSTPTVAAGDLTKGVEPQPLDEKTTINVGVSFPSEAFLPVIVAQEMGEFEKENLDVKISTTPDPASSIPLLDTGRIDISATGPFAGFYNAVDTGSDMVFIAAMGEAQNSPTSGGYYQRIPEGETTADCSDMEGKQVGLVSGWASSASLGFAKYLESCDLTPADVIVNKIDSASAAEALRNGAVEATYALEPATVEIVEDGVASQVAVNPNGLGGFAVGKLRNENPEAVQAFVRAMVRATQEYLQGDYRQNPEMMDIITDFLGVDEDTINGSKARLFDPNLDPADLGNLMVELQPFWMAVEETEGDILAFDEPLPLDELLDRTYVDNTKS